MCREPNISTVDFNAEINIKKGYDGIVSGTNVSLGQCVG